MLRGQGQGEGHAEIPNGNKARHNDLKTRRKVDIFKALKYIDFVVQLHY